jgi:hypothetical protein
VFAVPLPAEYQCSNYDIKLEKGFGVTNFTHLRSELFNYGECGDVCRMGCDALYFHKNSHVPW